MKKILLLIVLTSVVFAGCEKDASDDDIRDALVGKWVLIAKDCEGTTWRQYKADGTYDDFDGCSKLLYEKNGAWRIEKQKLIIKAKVFPIEVWYSFRYLSKNSMTIIRGQLDSGNPEISYRKE